MSTPTAPLLAPYTAPPPTHSLHLITSVLGSTSNWLVLRYLCDTLQAPSPRRGNDAGLEGAGELEGEVDEKKDSQKRKVVLVSFLRGLEFWRAEARRVGLDLGRLSKEGRFCFVDGVTELFKPATPQAPKPPMWGGALAYAPRQRKGSMNSPSLPLPDRTPPSPLQSARSPRPAHISLSGRVNPLLARPAPPTPPISAAPSTMFPPPRSSLADDSCRYPSCRKLRWASTPENDGGGLGGIKKIISSAIADVRNDKPNADQPDEAGENEVLLVLDQPDFLLASTGPSKDVSATDMSELIIGLRRLVRSAIVTVAADSPLMHSGQQPTPLEEEHSGLVVSLAHQAQLVLQLRGLDTGVARDVSGVLRVSKGGALAGTDTLGGGEATSLEEKEVLFFVQADGSVKVFERGE